MISTSQKKLWATSWGSQLHKGTEKDRGATMIQNCRQNIFLVGNQTQVSQLTGKASNHHPTGQFVRNK